MNDPVVLFLSLLAVACQIFVVGAFGLLVVSRKKFAGVSQAIAPIAVPFALAVAFVTMAGSLYMSEIKHYTPCRLCWIQRGFLYPQVIWMALLWWKPALAWIRRVAVIMLIIDIPVSIYHYILEWYPSIESSVCDPKIPCDLVWFREFHYLTMPLMALTASLTIIVLTVIGKKQPAAPSA